MYELLLVLVENQNRILEKEFLLQTVWPDSFVEEGNITFNIRQLRIVLGDDAQEPKYIETMPQGYRFIARSPTPKATPPSSHLTTAVEIAVSIKMDHARPLLAAAAIVFLVVIVGSFAGFREAAAEPRSCPPFTSDKLSTDGLVFMP
jgi:DNA-binding winged helix-turn-helix (wHTH) protein